MMASTNSKVCNESNYIREYYNFLTSGKVRASKKILATYAHLIDKLNKSGVS